MALQILSAGAAKGLVDRLRGEFETLVGSTIDGAFGAVGAIKTRFLSGAPCDVLILTAAQIAELTALNLLEPKSVAALGAVYTALAVPHGQPLPAIATEAMLRNSLLAATALYAPDMVASTAGKHVSAMLTQLEINADMAPKLRIFADGEAAMRALAHDALQGAVGCTQLTEIRNTPGLTAVGKLPPPHQLATVYTAAVSETAADGALARKLVGLLAGPSTQHIRDRCGFEKGIR